MGTVRVQVQLKLKSIINLGSIINLENLVEFKLLSLIIRVIKRLGFSGLYIWIVDWSQSGDVCWIPWVLFEWFWGWEK